MDAKRIAIIAVILVANLAMVYTRINPFANDSEIRHTTDLASFVAASRSIAGGSDPYNLADLKRQFADSASDVLPYVYTPVVAQVLLPFVNAPLADLQRWWLVASALSMSVFVVLLLSMVADKQWPTHTTWMMAIGLAMLLPIHFTMISGQVEAFLAPLIAASIWAQWRGRIVLAGVLLGSVIVVKHAVVFLVLWFLLERSYRTVVIAACTSLLIASVSMLLGGVHLWTGFVQWAAGLTYDQALTLGFDPSGGYNLSITGLLLRAGTPSALTFRYAGLAFLVIVTVVMVFLRSRRTMDRNDQFTVMSLVAVLALPFMWSHHLLYAGVAFATIFARAVTTRNTNAIQIALLAACALQVAPGMPLDRILRYLQVELPVQILGTLATVYLIILIVHLIRKPSELRT